MLEAFGYRSHLFLRFDLGNLWAPVIAMCCPTDSERKAFSYNKRTMDWAMGPFVAVVAIPRINNLRAVNTLISSTPAASTTISSIANRLQVTELFVQCSYNTSERGGFFPKT